MSGNCSSFTFSFLFLDFLIIDECLTFQECPPVGGYVEEVAEALRNFVDPSDPAAVPNVSPDLAAKALLMFGRSMMRYVVWSLNF